MLEEGGHPHGHRPHATGFRWLDISLALSACFVSLVTLWFAIHNARTMERLVAANSYPNVHFGFDTRFDFNDGQGVRPAVDLYLENTGIGPARLRSIELGFGGKAVATVQDLVGICCTQPPVRSLPDTHVWTSGDMRGYLLPAGKQVTLFAWPQTAGDPRAQRLETLRDRIDIHVCYCSVFDECYQHDSHHYEPTPVKACPTPPVPYTGG
jgi:hypothetical protein